MSPTRITPCPRRRLRDRGQGPGPEPIKIGTQSVDAGGIQRIEPSVSCRAIDDQMRVLQDAQVLRNRRTADRKAARELADRPRALQQTLENRQPGRIAEGIQLFGMTVNNH